MIEVKNLSKTYIIKRPGKGIFGIFKPICTEVPAVKDINFTINDGEIVALLGSNGAGKSTTIKMLTSILTPSSGEIKINGHSPQKRDRNFLSTIGLMMGHRDSLIYDLPIKDSYRYLRTIYNASESPEINEFLKKLNIYDLLDTPVRKLSLGQRKMAELVAALLHQPKILFLDEPTIGLDVQSKKEVLDFISYLSKNKGITVLITSHDLNDVEKVCKRMIYIDHGQIIFDGPTSNFGMREDLRKLKIVFESDFDRSTLEKLNLDSINQEDEFTYEIIIKKDEIKNFLSNFDSQNINEYFVQKVTLEDSVLDYVQVN